MIIIIDHYSQAPGEKGNNRFLYLADMFCAAGYDVEIVTTDFSHIQKKTRSIPQDLFKNLKYKYTMLHEPGYKKNVCVQRLFSHHYFGRKLREYLEQSKNVECVYIAVPSLDVGKVAADFCNSRNIPFYVDIQDIWPEAFEMAIPFSKITKYFLYPMEKKANYIYRSASYLFAVSETYLKRGLQASNRENGMSVFLGTSIPNFDRAIDANRVSKGKNEIWLGYVGTLGKSYNINIVTDAIRLLAKRGYNNIVFKVIGDGPQMLDMKQYAEGAPVEFLGRKSYEQMVGILASCDIAVNPIVKGAAQSIINKHGDYAAASLPVVSTQECEEYRALLEKYECGINCRVDDVQGIADAIELLICDEKKRSEMGTNSRRMAEDLFDRSIIYEKIVNVVIERLEQ